MKEDILNTYHEEIVSSNPEKTTQKNNLQKIFISVTSIILVVLLVICAFTLSSKNYNEEKKIRKLAETAE